MAKGSKISKGAMWILMGFLFVGLAGFGATNLSGNLRTIGTVGDKPVMVDVYARQLQNEIRAIEAQTREPLPFAQAQAIGLDRAVLQRLVQNRALDHETTQMGLSIGDVSLREEILQIPSFQGVNGDFDRESYRFALQQGGVTEAEFETSLREEAARTLLQGAIVGGVEMPEAYARTLVSYVGEERSFTWSLLSEADLTNPIAAPSDDELQRYYDDNADAFTLPPSKVITYAWLSPDALIDEIEVPEDELRAEYDARANQYNQPERRLVERLVFADEEAANRGAAALEVNGATFDSLVEARGLALQDVDLGDVSRLELDAAGEAVFAAEVGDVVGPLPSSLGPALFRVNGVLPAQNTSFEDARPDLQQELALTRAVRAVEARAQDLDDQLAGGVTLEQLAEATEITLGTLTWDENSSEGIAAYGDFREAAAALSEGDFPKIDQLADGGLFAMQLDEALPERPNPFVDARADVEAAWKAEQVVANLTAQATALVADLDGAVAFEAAGLDALVETEMLRNAFVDRAPPGFIDQVFQMDVGDVTVLPGDATVAIVRLDAITPASEDAQSNALLDQLSAQISQNLAQDIFNIYANDVVTRAVPQIDQRALQAVHVNFP
ncbi:peptidyl-prolyl cis-trans isomerase [uncultured Sulfitobacter sp.]|uniref:peptidyl-prolyl cis-trans isomerase n=1 Tax=uncultured Sulfitobacter sp. TaxID=191468 RepID=UPI002603ED23|nr:peptidyl-prolyl cis-trans isomerase [uncultured Sulfitobacter sp.]